MVNIEATRGDYRGGRQVNRNYQESEWCIMGETPAALVDRSSFDLRIDRASPRSRPPPFPKFGMSERASSELEVAMLLAGKTRH